MWACIQRRELEGAEAAYHRSVNSEIHTALRRRTTSRGARPRRHVHLPVAFQRERDERGCAERRLRAGGGDALIRVARGRRRTHVDDRERQSWPRSDIGDRVLRTGSRSVGDST